MAARLHYPLHRLGTWLARVALLGAAAVSSAAESPANTVVDVHRDGDRFETRATIHTPYSQCEAFQYLASHDVGRHVPGILDTRIERLNEHTVRVERWAEESVLFVPVKAHSVLEYTELPPGRMEFRQVAGDMKSYTGRWEVVPEGSGTRLDYTSVLEPNSRIPTFLIERFIQERLRKRVLVGVEYMLHNPPPAYEACRAARDEPAPLPGRPDPK